MATILTHAVAGAALAPLFLHASDSGRWIVVGAVAAMIPDVDVIAFGFGIPYSSPLGHRGLTHSPCFAAALAGLIVWRWADIMSPRIGWYLFAATASHGLLDALTNGGLGIGFLIPMTSRRFFFPWRPLEVCPLGVEWFFTSEVWFILKSEVLWVWVPSAAVCLIGLLFHNYR